MATLSDTHWQLPEPPAPTAATAQEYAYERLRFAIMVGGVPPGAALTIRGVAEALSLSHTPVRESLRRLCAEGALSSQSNRRIITPPMTEERHQELICTRVALEQLAVSRALPYVNDKHLDELTEIDLQMDAAISRQAYVDLVILNQHFHSTLYGLNPEQVCLPMIESAWLQLGPYNKLAAEHAGELTGEDWHKRLIDSLRARDNATAQQAIEADIRDGAYFEKYREIRG